MLLAKEKNSEGFSYYEPPVHAHSTQSCRLCTAEQLHTLHTATGWKVHYMGKRCVSETECSDCTFGKCIQLAKEKNSEGFSYSMKPGGTSSCRLCTVEQLSTLETMVATDNDDDKFGNNWAVYKKSGNTISCMAITSYSFNF